VGKAPYWRLPAQQPLIQVDIDEEVLGCNRPVDLAGIERCQSVPPSTDRKASNHGIGDRIKPRQERVAKLSEQRDKDRAKLDEKLKDQSTPMNTAHVARVCQEVFEDDAVIVFDGGNTPSGAIFTIRSACPIPALNPPFRNARGGCGPGAGAAAARPDKTGLLHHRDGAFGFHPQEVETAVRNNLKVIFLVCCDKQWGMVKINQQLP